jgi:hypothetical protein
VEKEKHPDCFRFRVESQHNVHPEDGRSGEQHEAVHEAGTDCDQQFDVLEPARDERTREDHASHDAVDHVQRHPRHHVVLRRTVFDVLRPEQRRRRRRIVSERHHERCHNNRRHEATEKAAEQCDLYYDPAEEYDPGELEGEYLSEKNTGQGATTITAADGESYTYDTCWRPPGVGLSTVGGFITGLISAGLPEVVTTQLIVRCRLPPRVAVATSVFTLGIAAAAGSVVHALSASPVWYIVAWSIPGVIIGGTVGTRVGKYVPSDLMELGLGVVFSLVGALVLGVELLA